MGKDKKLPTFEMIKEAVQKRSTTRGALRSVEIKLGDFLKYFDSKEFPLSDRQRQQLQFIQSTAQAYADLEVELLEVRNQVKLKG